MKFVLFVEGYTEQKVLPNFFRRWPDTRLKRRVGLQTVRFDGWPELIRDSGTKAGMYLRQIPRIMARICHGQLWDACRATLGCLPGNFGTLAGQLARIWQSEPSNWDACRATGDACRATLGCPDKLAGDWQIPRIMVRICQSEPSNWDVLPAFHFSLSTF